MSVDILEHKADKKEDVTIKKREAMEQFQVGLWLQLATEHSPVKTAGGWMQTGFNDSQELYLIY